MKKREYQWQFLLLIIVLTVFLFRFFSWNFVNLDLAFDEAQYWTWSLDIDWGYYSKPPLLAWLIRISSSTCGISEMCLRISSPILYSLSAFFISSTAYMLCETNSKGRAALLAGITWILIPGVSFSSGMISTDVPMLFFSSIVIWSFCCLLFHKNEAYNSYYIAALTVSLALGFLSKYAIVLLLFSLMVFFAVNSSSRNHFKNKLPPRKLIISIVLLFLLIFPHLWWNYNNGFITFQHTAANINVAGVNYSFYNTFVFFLEQFAVFGPINFIILLYLVISYKILSNNEKMLLILALVPIVMILVQAFISRAHANWAAISFIPASILVALFLDKRWFLKEKRIYYFSIFLSLIVLIFLPFYAYNNPKLDPFKKMRGWEEVVLQISEIYSKYPGAVLVADDRKILAESLYYMSIKPKKWVRWNADGKIHDHYELVTKHDDLKNEIGIMVSVESNNEHFFQSFSEVIYLGEVTRIIGERRIKKYKIWLLKGYNSS